MVGCGRESGERFERSLLLPASNLRALTIVSSHCPAIELQKHGSDPVDEHANQLRLIVLRAFVKSGKLKDPETGDLWTHVSCPIELKRPSSSMEVLKSFCTPKYGVSKKVLGMWLKRAEENFKALDMSESYDFLDEIIDV